MAGSRNYPAELRERAVRMVAEVRDQYSSEWAAIESVAAKLGIGTPQTLPAWVRRDQIDSGTRPGVSSDMAEELRRLRLRRMSSDAMKTDAGRSTRSDYTSRATTVS
jgi:transposase